MACRNVKVPPCVASCAIVLALTRATTVGLRGNQTSHRSSASYASMPILCALIVNLWCQLSYFRSRDSVVGIATGYELDVRGIGVRVPVGARFFLLATSSGPVLWPTQSPIQWVPGVPSPGLKRPGREADHSPPNSAEVKRDNSTLSVSFYKTSLRVLLPNLVGTGGS
jgi:hypothetical protein